MSNLVSRWGRPRPQADDTGASSVEYALMLAGIAALIVVTVFLFGAMVNDTYVGSCNDINDGVSANIGVSTDCG